MTREPFIAHSELTNEIYIVVGKEKYRVTEQAIKAVMAIKALEQEPILNKLKEKDEAKAVRYEGDGYADGAMVYDMAFCPNCEHEFEEDSENWECGFCPNCGQRLRWEE